MKGLNPEVMVYRLSADPTFKSVRQKKKYRSSFELDSSEKYNFPNGYLMWCSSRSTSKNGECVQISKTSTRPVLKTTSHYLK